MVSHTVFRNQQWRITQIRFDTEKNKTQKWASVIQPTTLTQEVYILMSPHSCEADEDQNLLLTAFIPACLSSAVLSDSESVSFSAIMFRRWEWWVKKQDSAAKTWNFFFLVQCIVNFQRGRGLPLIFYMRWLSVWKSAVPPSSASYYFDHLITSLGAVLNV